MRSFIVLCLIAVVCADNLGYNYRPVDHSNTGLSFAPGSGSDGLFGGDNASPSNEVGSYASPSSGSASYDTPAGVDKEFFTYTANDDDFNDPAETQRVLNSQNKKLRVVFIKGPENNGLENAALALAKQAAEQKTAIYVLQKHTDINDLANKLNAIRNNHNAKPEVHFVKYRTPEDAANAQHKIQSEYDNLGGQTQSHNGGVAPVINFASQAPRQSHGNNYQGAGSSPVASYGNNNNNNYQGAGSAPSANYLPASILRAFRFRH